MRLAAGNVVEYLNEGCSLPKLQLVVERKCTSLSSVHHPLEQTMWARLQALLLSLSLNLCQQWPGFAFLGAHPKLALFASFDSLSDLDKILKSPKTRCWWFEAGNGWRKWNESILHLYSSVVQVRAGINLNSNNPAPLAALCIFQNSADFN